MLNENSINRQQLASDDILDEAFHDLCKRFKNRGDHHDIWHLRFHWKTQKEKIKNNILAGRYQLSPVKMKKAHQQTIQVWSADDTLVLNSLRILMRRYLKEVGLNKFRHHGAAGKKMGHVIVAGTKEYSFQVRIILQDFYPSVNHKTLMAILRKHIKDTWVLKLLQQYLHHLQDDAGQLKYCQRGLYKGSSLASLLAGLYLQNLDELFESQVKSAPQNSTEHLTEKNGPVYFRWRDQYVYFCQEQNHFNEILTNMNTLLDQLDLKIDRHKSHLGLCKVENREVSSLKYLMNESVNEKIVLEIKEKILKEKSLKEQADKELSIKEQAHVAG